MPIRATYRTSGRCVWETLYFFVLVIIMELFFITIRRDAATAASASRASVAHLFTHRVSVLTLGFFFLYIKNNYLVVYFLFCFFIVYMYLTRSYIASPFRYHRNRSLNRTFEEIVAIAVGIFSPVPFFGMIRVVVLHVACVALGLVDLCWEVVWNNAWWRCVQNKRWRPTLHGFYI